MGLLRKVISILGLGFYTQIFAGSNQAIYEQSFDQGSGGAALTRATQEGTIFANPSLLPWGKKFHRWAGVQTSANINKAALGLGSTKNQAETLNKILNTPVNVGARQAMGWVSEVVGITAFGGGDADLYYKNFGSGGLPVIHLEGQLLGGLGLGAGVTLGKYMSVGALVKYFQLAGPEVELNLTDSGALKNFSKDPDFREQMKLSKAVGTDLGSLFFVQGESIDLRLALKIDDLGNTQLSRRALSLPQTFSAGLGLSLHSSADVIHVAVDYRDLGNERKEKLFKRLYLSSKFILSPYLALGAGLYHGFPSFFLRADLLGFNLGFGTMTKELGEFVGDRSRTNYLVSLGWGL